MAALPAAHDFKTKQPLWADTVTWKINNVAVNLTGYTPTLRVKFATGTVSYSTAQGLTVNSSGEVAWSLDTSTWAPGFYGYDLNVVSGSGEPNWLLEGTVEVRP